jgi:hypothetical protein
MIPKSGNRFSDKIMRKQKTLAFAGGPARRITGLSTLLKK